MKRDAQASAPAPAAVAASPAGSSQPDPLPGEVESVDRGDGLDRADAGVWPAGVGSGVGRGTVCSVGTEATLGVGAWLGWDAATSARASGHNCARTCGPIITRMNERRVKRRRCHRRTRQPTGQHRRRSSDQGRPPLQRHTGCMFAQSSSPPVRRFLLCDSQVVDSKNRR